MKTYLLIGGPWDWKLLQLRNGRSGTLTFELKEPDILWKGRYHYNGPATHTMSRGKVYPVLYWEGNTF